MFHDFSDRPIIRVTSLK